MLADLSAQLGDALHKALDLLQIPSNEELDNIKDKIADLDEIVTDLNQRCDDLINAEDIDTESGCK